MDRRTTFPVFGNAPDKHDRGYLDDMARKLNQLIAALRSPGEGRQSTLVLTDMPTNDSGIEPGTLFQVDGVVRVSLANRPYLAGVSAKGYVGKVSITT